MQTRLLAAALMAACAWSISAKAQESPPGFTPLFNGKDLYGWHGSATMDPRKMAAMDIQARDKKRATDDAEAKKHWSVQSGDLVNDGFGPYLTTDNAYGDIELLIDYKTVPKADSGIYLRATPQVQIWDINEPSIQKLGAAKGSGGLWNNSAGAPGKDPLVLADKPLGEWNRFRILQIGARTTVYLNDKLVVDHAIMENYWDRKLPLALKGPIQLQTHGGEIRWKNIFIREIPASEANSILAKKAGDGFQSIFNGRDLTGWMGPVENYEVVDSAIVCKKGKGGTIYAEKEVSDFTVCVEFKLPPGGNNGLAIRYPGKGDTAYDGLCEVQVLDDTAAMYSKLDARQYNGSAYGMVAPARGYLRPVGEWNFEQVTVKGTQITVELNGSRILDADLSKVTDFLGSRPHPGLSRSSGFFGFAGHSDPVAFRNVRIKSIE